jgi:hypothetical protein
VAGQPTSGRPSALALFLASFLACFSARRSRSLRSRLCFAIVVLLLLPAMRVQSSWICRPPESTGDLNEAVTGKASNALSEGQSVCPFA